MKKSELRKIIREEFLLLESKYEVYHKTYSSAINEIEKYLDKLPYDYEVEDLRNTYIDGFFKPKPGKTKRDSISLYKGDKEQRKAFHAQIYNRGTDGKTFELNMYVS